jgi:hypothetical protein
MLRRSALVSEYLKLDADQTGNLTIGSAASGFSRVLHSLLTPGHSAKPAKSARIPG